MLDLTSAVTAGNTPMVTVKMKQTERAGTKIWREGTQAHVFMVSVRSRSKNPTPTHIHTHAHRHAHESRRVASLRSERDGLDSAGQRVDNEERKRVREGRTPMRHAHF